MHGCVAHSRLGIRGAGLGGPEIPEEELRLLRSLCSEKGAEAQRQK